MFQKEKKSSGDVFSAGLVGAVSAIAIIGFVAILIMAINGLPEPGSTMLLRILLLVLAVVGAVFGLLGAFLTTSKIRLVGEKEAIKQLLVEKTKYNSIFLDWFATQLTKLESIPKEEFILFLKQTLFGYYRGENAVNAEEVRPTWDEVQALALILLGDYVDNRELVEQVKGYIRDRKREEIT